ncbi:hypothetical protein HJC23_012755 [Cyclotella cryptica]|uniref:Sec1-like protein n=1 Tax=Cyclotella cryptica TaxID=29204 RepID=A0ABD3Q9B7_9STRA|eukprot:CCRYP_008972-RA/>CCRYP_008972-RA protein AED:0.09 eAED:0.09 QI:0/-1/0/1/-1/1/1/0/668
MPRPKFNTSTRTSSNASSSSTSSQHQSLREIVQQHLLQNVIQSSESSPHRSPNQWMVLVVDPESLRVISSSIGMYNLMEHHVSIVENLTKRRAPFRDQVVVYLVEPKEESVQLIVEDWTPSKDKRGPLYGNAVFLYFLGRLDDKLFGRIKGCKELVKRIKVLKEVNLDFLTKDAQAFHFDMKDPSIYSDLYLSKPSTGNPLHNAMMAKLVTACATLNEYPHVRYPAKNALCKNLAFIFQQKMNEFVGSNREWWYKGDGLHPNSERATLLILDRKDDCLSPLIHEFTYEAMVNDLLPVDDDRITYDSVNAGTAKEGSAEATTKMDALLNDNDEVWVELRGKHIADVIQTLSNKIREIVNSSSGSALASSAKSNGKALSINQMAKALKALPEYREIMSKLSQHMQIAHQCMDAFNAQGLLELSELEQTLATGKTDEGRTPKLKQLLGETVEEFRRQSDPLMRLRLLAIVIVSQRGLGSDSDLQKLLGEANLSQNELKALQNLEKLGCPLVQRKEADSKGKLIGYLKSKGVNSFGQADSESEYSTSRYVCLLKAIMEEATSGKLSVDEYPSVMPLPDAEAMLGPSSSAAAKSVRKASSTSKWQTQSSSSSASGKKKSSHRGRQIVFMAGGMCYSELRSAREVMNTSGTEIVVGSTRFISPQDFLVDLKNLG